MHPRQNINELFCTFVKIEQDCFKGWIYQPTLSRNLERFLGEHSTSRNLENFLALYFHKNWIVNNCQLSQDHLAAYLQEVCYWAAVKTHTKLPSHKFKVSDCFQMAMGQLQIVLNRFDPQHGSTLKPYALITFRSLLINQLRNHHEVNLCSDWALLRKISQTRLETTLSYAGLNKNEIDECILAWNSFKNIFSPTKTTGIRQLSEPDPATWQQIANFYNNLRQLPTNSPAYSPLQLKNLLQKCSQLVRQSFYPQQVSLNQCQPNQPDTELLEDLSDHSPSILSDMIAAEDEQNRERQLTNLKNFLSETLVQLQPELLHVLILYYKEGLTQTEIANTLDTKQYTVSRRLTKARETLLKALGKWSRDEFGLTINTEVMAQLDEVMEQWLENHYQKQTVAA